MAGPSGNSVEELFRKLLSFDQMIGTTLIRIIYYVGLVGIVLTAAGLLLGGLAAIQYNAMGFIIGVFGAAATLTVGTLVWRFYCELMILAFKIFDRLGEIRDRLPGSRY